MNGTINYYNDNAQKFMENTQNADMQPVRDKFLRLLDSGAHILDYGCGSGRDTKYFLENGFQVTAIDGSAKLCRLASAFTGIEVKEMLFQELDDVKVYDGIWACSSILHLSKRELLPVLRKMSAALKDHGVIYASFKYGHFEGMRNERYFTDFTEETFEQFIAEIPELLMEVYWITGDVRPGRGDEMWLNLILRKRDIC